MHRPKLLRPKLGPVWWGLMVLSLGMLGWGLRPFPMDTRDATLEQALARGQLDRATAILEARQADRPEEAPLIWMRPNGRCCVRP